MKRALCLILVCILCLSLASCGKSDKDIQAVSSADIEETVGFAIEKLKDQWSKTYDEVGTKDRYLEIKNTRVITIKDNNDNYFKDIDKIVEFMLLTNYLEMKPSFYSDLFIFNNVIIYRDGHAEVQRSEYINVVRTRTYATDFSDVIGSVDDLGDAYNAVYHLEKGDTAEELEPSSKHFDEADKAVDLLQKTWTDEYRDTRNNGKNAVSDGYLEIKNTRVISMKENDSKYFKDVDKIVEFALMTNYFDLKPSLYTHAYSYYQVIFYRDGHTDVPAGDYFGYVRGITYETDFSDVIASVDDLGAVYNAVYHL